MTKSPSGTIAKGHLKGGKPHGTYEYFYPETEEDPAVWVKRDFEDGKQIGEDYDIRYV